MAASRGWGVGLRAAGCWLTALREWRHGRFARLRFEFERFLERVDGDFELLDVGFFGRDVLQPEAGQRDHFEDEAAFAFGREPDDLVRETGDERHEREPREQVQGDGSALDE